jgi:hypothetical protein
VAHVLAAEPLDVSCFRHRLRFTLYGGAVTPPYSHTFRSAKMITLQNSPMYSPVDVTAHKSIRTAKFKKVCVAAVTMVAAQLCAGIASAAPPANVLGTWNLQANQASGPLIVSNQGVAAGTCKSIGGSAFGQPMNGVYCPVTGRIQFIRLNANLRAAQVFTGSLGDVVNGLPLRMAGTFFVQNPSSGFFGEFNFDANK